jgi:hypothetical protein
MQSREFSLMPSKHTMQRFSFPFFVVFHDMGVDNIDNGAIFSSLHFLFRPSFNVSELPIMEC